MGVLEYEVNRVVAEAKWDIDDALVLAVQQDLAPDVIKALIEQVGADVNAKGICGWTVLMWSAYKTSCPEVIKILVDAGADLLACDEKGKTVLDWAKKNENTSVAEMVEKMLAEAKKNVAGKDVSPDN